MFTMLAQFSPAIVPPAGPAVPAAIQSNTIPILVLSLRPIVIEGSPEVGPVKLSSVIPVALPLMSIQTPVPISVPCFSTSQGCYEKTGFSSSDDRSPISGPQMS